MKTAAWEAAPQIALRNCSKGEVGGKSIYKVLVKTEFSTVRSLVSKKSACNAGDLGLIPKSGRFPGERNGNPLQYSCLENPMDKGAWQATVHGVTRLGHDLALNHQALILQKVFC